MDKLIPIGRIFFAIAIIGLGIEHFIFKEFITGRAPPWPPSLPGGVVWAYLSGVAFVAMGGLIVGRYRARTAAMVVGLLIFVWALLRHIPILFTDPLLSPAWTRAGKALTFFGGALAIAATFPKLENRDRAFTLLGRICLGLFLVTAGIQHFIYTEFVASLIPGWFPGNAVFWTYFAGVALFAGGIGLFIPLTARAAALLSGGMVFSWFWIVHIPRTFATVSDGIAVFEALAVSGIALVLAGPRASGTSAIFPK